MGVIRNPGIFTSQPQYPTIINGSNPLAVGLLKAFIPAVGLVQTGGASISPGAGGLGFKGGINAYYTASANKIVSGKSAWTILSVFSTTQANNNNGKSQYCERAASGNDILKLEGLGTGSNNVARLTLRNDGGTLIQINGTSTINDGRIHAVAAVEYAINDHRIFTDGKQEATSSTSVASNYTNSLVSTIGNDIADIANSNFSDPIYAIFLWERALSPQEIKEISINPWQIFKAPQRPVFVGAATASAVLTGTATASITEADIVTGGKTIILTLTGDTWVASGATFDAQRQNIINGIDSAQAEATGWDAVVKAGQGVAGVVRTSNTVVTITLDAFASYNITALETITVTIPGTAVSLGNAIVAAPTFGVSAVSAGVIYNRRTLGHRVGSRSYA